MNLSLPKTYFKTVFVVLLFLIYNHLFSQTPNGTLDFGNPTNNTTATTANTGFGGVRIGTGGGSFTIQNPGQAIGTQGELRGVAPTSTSINSVGVTDAQYGTATSTFTISFDLYLSGGSSGTWYFFAGNGTSFAAAQSGGFTGNQVFTGLRWAFGASNTITTNNRNAGNWNTTGITGTPFAQSTSYKVEIIGNNSATTVNYTGGSIAAYKYDLWVNDVLVGDDLSKAQLANGDVINAFRFYGESSTGNVAQLAIDNVVWYNTCYRPSVGPTVTTLAASSISTTGADLNGTINANGTTTDASFEYGTTAAYGFSATATPSSATGTTATSITATIGSLALNTQYHFRAVGTESATVYNGSDLTFYTLAATPGALAVNNEQLSALDVTVNSSTENGNPSTTQYAIQEIGGQYVQANGSLGATAVWQTAATWGTTTVTGLAVSTLYTFQVKARNGENVETAFGTSAGSSTLTPETVDYAVVQFPNTTQTITEGNELTVYIRAYEDGITTIAGSSTRLKAWVGYSATNDNPANVGWTWVEATFNVQVGNDDEYQANIGSGFAPGTYYYAARFEIDDSGVYVYGGAGGNWSNNNVTLNVNADVVDFANIQFPTTATITEGGTVAIFAQVYEPGVTEGVGQGAGITAEIGYSTTDSTPDATWTWLAATHNPSVTGNNDEYQVDLGTGLAPGTYYYASRFIKTGSSTYAYGGTTGNWNNNNGVLTVNELETPVATEATAITQTQFTANWEAVEGATGYEIDVYEQTITFATDLFISEYVEGSSNNKYIEIYNGTGADVDLGDYDLANYSNGSFTVSSTLALTGTLVNGSTYVIRNTSATIWGGTSDLVNNTVLGFNGNDVIALRYLGTNIDVVGTIGSNANFAINTTLTRNSSIISPTTTYDAGQWISSPEDTVVDLGSHTFDGGVSTTYILEDVNVGNVTSYQVTGLDPNTTYYYRVRAINNSITTSNSDVIDVTTRPSVVTWDGTEWSNSDIGPDETIDAIIDGVYVTGTHGEFTSKKLTVTSGSLTVSSGTSITVEDVIENELSAAAIVVKNNANLIQNNDVTNIGSITVERNSSEVMRLDYTLWSSPVAGQNLLAFSPQTMVNRFYVYNPTADNYATIVPSTNSFEEGKSYLIRTPDNHPTTPTSWLGTFTGVPFNGNVTVSVDNDTFNAVGNPYPSTIDADDFIVENDLEVPLYFWRKINGATGTAYATYTLAGGSGTGSSASDDQEPNGIIQVGQGFIARSTSNSLVFTNEMRRGNHDNQFFRNSTETVNRNRIWLNLSNTQSLVGQTMIAYMENTSLDFDAKYDGKYINDSQTALTSLLNNQEYAVQARGLFTAADVVPMSFKTGAAGTFTISLANVDGLFETEEEIFLKDNLAGIEHNLRNSAYQFTSDSGVFGSRFEVVYQSTLGVTIPEFANQTIVFAKDNNLNVQSSSSIIKGIQVYDVQGRLVLEVKDINSSTYTTALNQISNGVLLVKVSAENGQTTTKKIIK